MVSEDEGYGTEVGDPIIDQVTFAPIKEILWPLRDSLYWDISEVSINGPGEVWVEDRRGGYGEEPLVVPAVTNQWIWDVCSQLGRLNGIPFGREMPVIACRLTWGHRFQGVAGKTNTISGGVIGIRVKRPFVATFEEFNVSPDMSRRLVKAVQAGKKIIISGGTSSGKTTFMNLLLSHLPGHLRVISIQDVDELYVGNRNYVGLLGSRTVASNLVTMAHLIDSTFRLNPTALVVSEIAIHTAFPVLQVVISGHDYFMTTIHADDELSCLAGYRLRVAIDGRDASGVVPLLVNNIDLIVQLEKTDDGRRRVVSVSDPKTLPWREITEQTELRLESLDPLERAALTGGRTYGE